MVRSERSPLVVLIGVLGLGLIAAGYAIWALTGSVRQQRADADALRARDAENTQALSDQLRLVRELQRQVRLLGGTPLTQAPSPVATQRTAHPNAASPTATPSAAAQRPAATPSPTPRPTRSPVSPSPRPSPTPTCLVHAGSICL